MNAGMAQRFDDDAGLSHTTSAALPTLAVYRAAPQRFPMTVGLLERHPLSSQTFLPMRAGRWLVVVARAGETPAAFLADGAQGVTYAPGIWHSPLIALDRATDFAMLMWESGTQRDTELRPLATVLTIQEP